MKIYYYILILIETTDILIRKIFIIIYINYINNNIIKIFNKIIKSNLNNWKL